MENNIDEINENIERCQSELYVANKELSELVDSNIDDVDLENKCNEIMQRVENITEELNQYISLL